MKTQSAFRATPPASVLLLLALAGCSSGSGTGAGNVSAESPGAARSATPAAPDAGGTGFSPPPLAAGFTRYRTHPVMVPAGQDLMWEEWVAPPIESDMDIVTVTGAQSKGGHHANLYATTTAERVGTNRAWKEADQLTTRTLGGIGGEGNLSALPLPAGVVFRVKKGSAMMIQSHFLNAGTEAVEGVTVLDAKFTPLDPSAQVGSIVSNTSLQITLPPGAMTTVDFKCLVNRDYSVLWWANHMHNWGVSARTELINVDGTTTPLQVDPKWDPSWAFHPIYTKFTLQSPRIIPAGSTIHTTCTYVNKGSTAVSFPDEMCVFAGVYLGDKDASCVEGTWQ